jgi:uncharacterized membrane protein
MKKIKNLYYAFLTLVVSSIPTLVFATSTPDLSDRIDNAAKSVQAGGSLFVWIVGAAGIILLFMGIMGLKKYADDQRQNPLMKPMIYMVAGALMSGFTTFRNILTSTSTGSDATGKINEGATFKSGT